MYVEQNLNQQIVSKPDVPINCVTCSQVKKLLKALVLNGQTLQTCSEYCWKRLLESRLVQTAAKCETCTKFVNMEALTPSFYLASDARTFGFCSATCKNVYVLKNRQILACTNCKVRLVELLPKSESFIAKP
jgi:ribosomal protein L24E